MATPASPEAIEIRRRGRQRLIGAIAIVVLLVVFVPMLLDSQPRAPRNEPSMQIPPKDKAPPLPAPRPAPAATPEPPDVARVTPQAAPKAAPAAAKPAPGPSAAKSAPAPRLEGFAVQVGAFRDEETLRQARAKLTSAGISHYTERVGNGELTRLRAGPFPTREAAEKAQAALKRAALDGQVVPLP